MSFKVNSILGILFICVFLGPVQTWSASTPVLKTLSNNVVEIGTDRISANYLEFLIKENMVPLQQTKKIIDVVVEDALLSNEAIRLGLDKSPLLLDRVGKQSDHFYMTALIKARFPNRTFQTIIKNYNEYAEQVLNSYVPKNQLTIVKIAPISALAETNQAPQQRKEIILANFGQEKLTLQDALDLFPTYKEQNFIERYLTLSDAFLLQAFQMKLAKREFTALATKNPVYNECLLRIKQTEQANAVRAYYRNPYAKYSKGENSKEYLSLRLAKPKAEELKRTYDQNQKTFLVSDNIKARMVTVTKPEEIDEIVSSKSSGRLKSDEDFKLLVKKYSGSPEAEKDSDLGLIYNPVLHPDAKIPEVLPPLMVNMQVFQLKKGMTSFPFQSKKGYHVLYVYDSEEKQVPFDNPWARQICRRLWEKQVRTQMLTSLVERLKASPDLKVIATAMKEIVKKYD